MADEPVKIQLFVSGRDDINNLIKDLNTGNASIDQMSTALRTLQKYWNALDADARGKFGPGTKAAFEQIDKLRDNTEKLTTAQTKSRNSYFELGQALRQHTMDNLNASKAFGPWLSNLSNGAQTIQEYRIATVAAGQSSALLEMGMTTLAGGIVIADIALLKFIWDMKDFAVAGARMEMLRGQFNKFSTKEGLDATKTMANLREVTNREVTELQILQATMQFKLLGTSMTDITKMLEFAEQRSKLLGKSFEEVVQSLLRVEMGGGKRAARSLGLIVDMDEAEAKYALSIGKTSDKLNDAEKRTGFYKAVLDAAGTSQDAFAGATNDTLSSINQLNTAYEDFKNELSKDAGVFKGFWDEWALKLRIITSFLQLIDSWENKRPNKPLPAPITAHSQLPGMISPRSAAGQDTGIPALQTQALLKWQQANEQEFAKASIALNEDEFQKKMALLDLEETEKKKAMEKEITNVTLQQQALLQIENEYALKRRLARRENDLKVAAEAQSAAASYDAGRKKFSDNQQKLEKQVAERLQYAANKRQKAGGSGVTTSLEDNIKGAMSEYSMLFSVIESGVNSLGQAITTQIHDKLVEAFHGANSIAQQFILGVLDGIMKIGEKAAMSAAIGGVLSMIPGVGSFGSIFSSLFHFDQGGWINEPVLGVGMHTGAGYTIAERRPEYVQGANGMGQHARFGAQQAAMRPSIHVVPIVNNTGLAVQVEVGNRINKTNRRY